jgi:hypothetical protein
MMKTAHLHRNRAVLSRSRNTTSVHRIAARSLVAAVLGAAMLVAFAGTDAYAADFVPSLGVASPYAVLAALPGTSDGPSTITGDLGLAASSSTSSGASASSGLLATGLLSGVGSLTGSLLGGVTGVTNVGNVAASSAEGAASAAYRSAAGETPTRVIAGSQFNNITLTPGVYALAGTLVLAGRVILDAHGNANPDFVFQVPSDLRSATGAQVLLGAGVRPSDVLWQVGGATALAPNSSVVGTILSNGPISLGAGVKLLGRAISLAGPVNLDRDVIALPLVSAAAGAAVPALSAPTSVVLPSTGSGAIPRVAASVQSVSMGAGFSLPVLLHLLSVPAVSVPTATTGGSSSSGRGWPTGLVAGAPLALPFIPLGDIGVPELAVPTPSTGIALPSATTPMSSASGASSGTTSSSTGLSLPLSGLSLPSLTTPSLSIPDLATAPSTSSAKGSIARGRVKESAPTHASSGSHAKSSTSPAASGSPIPSGAPQTGFGGMAGSTASRVLLALLALLIAAGASTFAVRSRRYQSG